MAITQVGSTNTGPGNSSALTIVLNKPTGTASGHLLVAIITAIGSGATITGPSGWTEVDTATSTNGVKMSLWAKIAGGSEGSTYTWTESALGSQRFVGTITAWSGVNVVSLATAINTSTEHGMSTSTTAVTASTPTLGSSTFTAGRVLYSRSSRIATSTPITFTESTGGISSLDSTGHGNNSGGSISYSHCLFADDADFSGAGSKSGLSTTASATPTDNMFLTAIMQAAPEGTASATLGNITSDFAADHRISGTLDGTTLGSITADFAGLAAPPSGDITSTLGNISASVAATSDFGGPLAGTLGNVTADVAGSVNPIGSFGCTLPSISIALYSETRPFGEQVIVIEPEQRAFQVIDEDPGLIAIYPSQVTEA